MLKNKKISRQLSLFMCIVIIFVTILSQITVVSSKNLKMNKFNYKDKNKISDWAIELVKEATDNDIILGYEDGKFYPKNSISRAEFVKIIVNALDIDMHKDKKINFKDVNKKDWFYEYVNAAYHGGIVEGEGDIFNPHGKITRQEISAIITRALDLNVSYVFRDIKDINKASNWAKKYIIIMNEIGLMRGYQGEFDPKGNATREMATVVIMRAQYYLKNGKLPDANAKDKNVRPQIEKTANFMMNSVKSPQVGSIAGEWHMLGLARSHVNIPKSYIDKYYENVENYVNQKEGDLHRVKYTEYSRLILALNSIGKDPKNVGKGYDLVKPLSNFDIVPRQGINGPIFALIAMDSNNYDFYKDAEFTNISTREKMKDFILDRELPSGGWHLRTNNEVADVDITAMAIQGLSPFYGKDKRVTRSVDKALKWLSAQQQSNGAFKNSNPFNPDAPGEVTVESTAQVAVALTSIGIDPHRDADFVEDGNSVIDGILDFKDPSGGFYHIKSSGSIYDPNKGEAAPGEVNGMATEQSMYALVAYDRFVNGQNKLYDMTDVK